MELDIPRNSDGPGFSWFVRRLRDNDRLPIGKARYNPILDTHMYEVEYPNGHKPSLDANAISENIFALVYGERNINVLFEEIIDHQNEGSEVKHQYYFIKTQNKNKPRRR